MIRATAEERALARAATYRLLSLTFAYPTPDRLAELHSAAEVAEVAANLIDSATAAAVHDVQESLRKMAHGDLEPLYQRTFTLSYNEDCPIYETAFSARHIFQQTQQQADIAGFYRAFGVNPTGDRPDHLALEVEFLYLLTLKEAVARDRDEPENVAICRSAQRSFVRDHLARWAPQIAGRIAVAGRGTLYEAAARLLRALVAREERFLRVGSVTRFTDEPILIADEPGEFTCPIVDSPTPVSLSLTPHTEGGPLAALDAD